MIFNLIFTNRNSRVTPREEYIDIFEGSTENMQDWNDDMDSSVERYYKSTYEDLKKHK